MAQSIGELRLMQDSRYRFDQIFPEHGERRGAQQRKLTMLRNLEEISRDASRIQTGREALCEAKTVITVATA
jgi:hypothetical protein